MTETIDTASLRALAEAAEDGGLWYDPEHIVHASECTAFSAADAQFIPACSPATIIALLDRLAAAEARNATLTDDAARYRYLRNDVLVDGEICEDLYVAVDQPAYPNSWALTGAELDEAVDAAIAMKEKTP